MVNIEVHLKMISEIEKQYYAYYIASPWFRINAF
jgi:hypothetical protein